MSNTYFQFKQFRIDQAQSGMKITTDSCVFGALVAECEKEQENLRILDIGAGTGLLSLMLTQKIGGKIDAIEINEEAYQEAKLNFERSPWSERIQAHLMDIQSWESDQYDLIICNPPFFHGSTIGASKSKNQALHDGTLNSQELARMITKLIKPSGRVWVLYPDGEMEKFKGLIGMNICREIVVKNLPDAGILRKICCFSNKSDDTFFEEISVYQSGRNYSPRFIELLKDYYLNL